MEITQAIGALGALAQATRLEVFRLLLRQGPNGLPAGEIAAALAVPPATLSFHLKQLEQAGLLTARRDSRLIYYAADIEGVRRLLAFLTEDCCQGRPEICGDLAAGLVGCGTAGVRARRPGKRKAREHV
jgi:ArsR family transcriptional regulator